MNPVLAALRDLAKPTPAWFTLFAAVLLTTFGILAIDTVSPTHADTQLKLWLPVAVFCMCCCIVPHHRLIGYVTLPLLILSVLALVYLLAPGAPFVRPINGARSWIILPVMRVQPAEFVKILFVLALARYLRFRSSYRSLLGLLVPFMLMFIPVMLILKQPDLGTALLFAPALFAVLVAAGAKLRHLFTLVGLAIAAVVVVLLVTLFAPPSFQILKPHQQQRIVSMVSLAQGEKRHEMDAGFQQSRAMRLIAAAGVSGYGKSESNYLITESGLPEAHNDMIFTVIVNRWGATGGLAVIGLYFVFIVSTLLVSARTKDPFARLACVGFAAMIFTQATINIGMHLGVLPITGITLPFISYGGSSLLSLFIMTGLIVNFSARPAAMLARPSFEYDNPDAIFQ
ncbi:FtsW/RodA/SpoVE family cell cycle protein [Poriferisphaera sp. WC338]|uniref:FtsW/RodA/SpoVE family cell cycle protein n=1 Tax=Poriferisphaera sp. WC338 TaxID=3425129 RepID=UPI003D8174D1